MAVQYCNYDIKGTLTLSSIANATTDTDKFLVSDNGVVKYMTNAQVVDYIDAVTTIYGGEGINVLRLDSAVTVSVNYDSADTDNLIFGSTPYTSAVATKPYTPYILVADSNPGISFGEVKSLRIQSIPMNLLGDATGNIDMGGFRILDVSDPSSAQDAATKAYVDAHGGGLGPFLPLAGGTMTGNIVMGDNDITGIDQLTFSSGTYLTDVSSNYIELRYASTAAGGIIILDGDGSTQGYLYADGQATSSFGLLDGSGSWAVKCAEDAEVELRYDNSKKFETTNTGVTVTGAGNFTGNIVANNGVSGQITISPDNIQSNQHLILGSAGGANIEMYTNGNAYYDAVSHNFRDSDASPAYFSITASQVNSFVKLSMASQKIIDLATPTLSTDAANKSYVDNAVAGVPGASYINAATFSTSNGIITGTGVGSAGFTVDIDGRYPIGNVAAQPFYIALQQNPVGTTYGDGVSAVPTYYFGQKAGDNDAMKFYAESAATNDITAVWEINDDLETGLTWLFRNKKTYSPYTATDALKIDGDGDVTVGKDLTIPEYLYHTGDTNTYLRFQSDSIELQAGGWKVFGNTTLKYGALYGDNALRVYATQAGGYINGTLTVDTINNATSDTDKFLVSDGDEIKYRTGAEVLADIGAGTGTVTGTGTSGQIAIFNGSSSITSNSGLSEVSTGVLYVNSQVQVKGVNAADYTVNGDTDTGLGSFDGSNGVSLVSKGQKQITVKENAIKFDPYTSTSVATTGSLNANQNNQASSQDTLATLAVDPSGNVVRGEQEGTWTFTRAQLNGSLGNTLISAPGANKAVIITESDWMVEYSATGAVSGNQSFDVRQANIVQANANITTLPGARINEIINAAQGTPTNPSYGFCARDIPLTTRTYKTNVATTLNKKTGDQLPAGVISISIKLKYRLFNATTF